MARFEPKNTIDTILELPDMESGRFQPIAGQSYPKADFTGKLVIGGIEINCAVLVDDRRVLAQRHVFQALGRHKNPRKGQILTDDRPAFLAARNLEPFIPVELRAMWTPIMYKSQGGYKGNLAFGYPAEMLPLVCGVFLDLSEYGVPSAAQKATIEQCKKLIRGFATVGIVALVDEATGFQEVRDRKALQEILRKYISPELLPWARMFPPEFYEHLFRLRGWSWKPMSVKRPILVGKLTNSIVYDRLAAGVRQKLQERARDVGAGATPKHMHRWLSESDGRPALERHLHATIAIMRMSKNWKDFMSNLNMALPSSSTTPTLPFTYDEEGGDE